MKNFGPQSYFFPSPVMIIATYNEEGIPNAMNAAWGGLHDTNQVHICLSSDHKTTENIVKTKSFTVSFATKELVAESDYFGLESGNKVPNKIKKANLHVTKSTFVNAPIIEEYPVTLECKVNSLNEIDGTTYLVGDIINVCAKETVLDEQGKIDITKCHFISYDSSKHQYVVLGEVVGHAFKDGLKLK